MEIRTCKDCGEKFILTDGEIEFFQRKGLNLPKRCKNCRNKGKSNIQKGNIYIREKDENPGRRSSPYNVFLAIACIIAVVIVAVGLISKSDLFTDNGSALDMTPRHTDTYETANDDNILSRSDLAISKEEEQSETGENGEEQQAADTQSEYESTDNEADTGVEESSTPVYTFRNYDTKKTHYEKHGIAMGFSTLDEYESAASDVINNPDSLCKTEAEDGDLVYFLEQTGEIVFLSTDGYIRSYFIPEDGIEYFNRQ